MGVQDNGVTPEMYRVLISKWSSLVLIMLGLNVLFCIPPLIYYWKLTFDISLSQQTILNVNVPDLPISELRGIEVTRLGSRHCAEPTLQEVDPRGKPIYGVGLPGAEEDAGEGTDFHAIRQQRVSITPLQLDLTNHGILNNVAGWVDGITFEAY